MAKKKIDAEPSLPFSQLRETEVEAYGFIRERLKDLGWVLKNPSLNTGGQVWTQNQCLSHPEIKLALGAKRPENIVKLTETLLWVIEAKASRRELDKAVDEAASYYSHRINNTSPNLRAVIATGVAGTEDALGYLIRSKILLGNVWHPVTINGQEATGLLSPKDIQSLLDGNTSDVHEYTPSQWVFMRAAERINGLLHLGGINKNDRAKTIAALLLSVAEEAPPNVDTSLSVLIGEINTRSEAILTKHRKPDFAPFVKILRPTNTSNHVKFKNALVRTIQELLNLNIRSAMNSSTDVLGQFYEVFLKYGNGAKEIGIVLTPRHITRFAVEAVGVSSNDIVLDVACGTGGFLVAAFDHVRRESPSQIERFKKRNLFGIEQESAVAALAIVNMIFRGDGKNNITEGNCFTTYLVKKATNGNATADYSTSPARAGEEPITRVLMNPPFALKSSKEKEYHFVSHALSVMADSGVLFSLLPLKALFGAGEEKTWRRDELLRHHTLLAVVTLPNSLFVPAALKQVAAVIVRKGFPHPKQQPVFWAKVSHDGHLVIKKKRLPASELRPARVELDQIPQLLPVLRNFLANPMSFAANVPMFYKTEPIDFADPLLELLPEAYLDTGIPSNADLAAAVDEMARQTVAFLVRFGKESLAEEFVK